MNQGTKMKRLIIGTTAFLLTGGTMAVQAQDGPPSFQPVEMYACNYRDGQDQGDFDRALRMMSEVESSVPYAGYQLFPGMVTPEQTFDFIYVGVWGSGTDYGSDMAAYSQMAEDEMEAWNEAAECGSSLWASHLLSEAPGDGSDQFMVSFQDCKVADGRSYMQAVEGMRRWVHYRADNGMALPTWAWFPVYGGAPGDFAFKLITGFGGYEDVGNSFSWMVDNEAYLVRDQMLQGLVSCDVGRMYYGREVMDTFQRD
jgi:hypothetical protein